MENLLDKILIWLGLKEENTEQKFDKIIRRFAETQQLQEKRNLKPPFSDTLSQPTSSVTEVEKTKDEDSDMVVNLATNTILSLMPDYSSSYDLTNTSDTSNSMFEGGDFAGGGAGGSWDTNENYS